MEFYIFLPYGEYSKNKFERLSYSATHYLSGDYESEVLSKIIEEVDNKTVFWQVGARFGYFSMAIADYVESVLAIEPLSKNIECIEKSIDANGYNNVRTFQTYINDKTTLDDIVSNYSYPDVVVMDIEGWELKALQNSDTLVNSDVTLIIEVHRRPLPGTQPPNFSPNNEKKVRDLLTKQGYNISFIEDKEMDNYHIVAKK
jgi:hypothetical protein